MIVAGVGFRRGASADEIEKVVRLALGVFQLPVERLNALATESEKATEPAFAEAARRLSAKVIGLHRRGSRPGRGPGADAVEAGAGSQGRAVDRRGARRWSSPAATGGCSARGSRRRSRPAPSPSETGDDGAFHRRRPWRARPDHGARPRPDRALPGLPLCRLAGAPGVARALPAGRAHRRHRADVARRDRGRVPARDRGRPGRGAAAFGRPLGLERDGRAASPARRRRDRLHRDARRAVLRGGRCRARPGTDLARSGADRRADAHVGARFVDAVRRETGGLCGDRRHARDSSLDPCAGQGRGRARAVLWRGVPGRDRLSRELAGRDGSSAARSA